MRRGLALFTLLAVALSTVSFADVTRAPITNFKFKGGSNDTASPQALPLSQHRVPVISTLDETYNAGTTWYDDQHNGTMGKMIAVDEMGWVHMVWTNGVNSGSSTRHVFYNAWNPALEEFIYAAEGGAQVDPASRGGYTSIAVHPDGHGYPVFHEETTTSDAHAAASIDFLPQSGAFTTFEPSYLLDNRCGTTEDMEIIWPHVAIDIDGNLQVVSSENPCTEEAGDPQRFYYSRAIPHFDEFGFGDSLLWQPVVGEDEFMEIDTVMVLAPDIAASRHSHRVAIVWAKSRDDLSIPDSATQRNNDIIYMMSEDGGLNWGPEVNITNFEYPDLECLSGDTAECDRDTFRVYTDLNVIFDRDDFLHIVFTTSCYWALEGTISRYAGQIWHWSDRCADPDHPDSTGEISPIAAMVPDYLTSNWALDIGDWQYVMQRPSISCDDVTGDLYCSYQFADTNQWSLIGIPQADAWVSRSVDGGRSWSQAVNVTQTVGDNGGQGSTAGGCAHEHAISLSETVNYYEGVGYLNMEYVLDLDAGPGVGDNPTGIPTLNPVIFQRIPVTDIPAEPRWDHTWPQIHVDGRQVPYNGDPDPDEFVRCNDAIGGDRRSIPKSFELYQNYPNPFNPSTSLQFDLAKNMNVTLSVFNVLGQEVATLLNNKALTAGVHVTDFDASNLPSGVYIYQLKAEGLSQSRKMILLK
ncbi:T9SS type A sorting domain-containing protein [bacterium]|nr:T9SS type A sorting domain-containing protein [bacterium]